MVVKVDNFLRSFNAATSKIKNNLAKWVDRSLEVRKSYAEAISPTDTREYINAHKIKSAVIQWNKIIGANENDASDAFIVEFGASKSPVNRHKWPPRDASTVIYNGVWANVYQRTNFDTKKQVETILSNAFWW